VVWITCDEMNLQPSNTCEFDAVILLERSINWQVNLCNNDTTAFTYTSFRSGSSFRVVFLSDHSINEGRFSLSWKFVSQAVVGSFVKIFISAHNVWWLGSVVVRASD